MKMDLYKMKVENGKIIKRMCIALGMMMCLSFVACNNTQTEIDEKCRSGVVLILNQWYYTLKLPGINTFYFSADDNKVLDFEIDEESASNCIMSATGTGFYISKDGQIATNRHVASSTVDDRVLKRKAHEILNGIIALFEEENELLDAKMGLCVLEYSKATSKAEKEKILELHDQFEKEKSDNNEYIRILTRTHAEDADIQYHSSLYVAYNETFVKSLEDFYPATLLSVMDLEEEYKDLAIIQLNSKETPNNACVFDVPSKNMLEHYSFGEYLSKLFGEDKNEELYMIGFNKGLDWAPTSEGIMSQCTKGSISRKEKERLLYSINAEHGSSGSPVMNRRGQLVAINYAGMKDAKNFNFGVKEQYLYELIQKQKNN